MKTHCCSFNYEHEISKHLFIPNFANVKCGYVSASPENIHLKESCYEARSEKELPVLIEYIDSSKIEAPTATHLDIILYSRDQITKENEAMGTVVSVFMFLWCYTYFE